MIIQRKPKEFFVALGRDDLDGSILNPFLPSSPIPFSNDSPDRKIKRVPIYSNISGALSGRGVKEGETVTIYRVSGIYPSDILRPSSSQYPLAEPLSEYWALSGIQLRKIGDVKVGKVIRKKEIPLGKLQRKHTIEFREWED